MGVFRTTIWRAEANELIADRKAVISRLKRCRQLVLDGTRAFDDCEEAQQIVQAVAETIQQEAHDQIAGVVTKCLSAVFDDPYEFRIHFERARGHTEAVLVFTRDGYNVNPMDASGGGVVDVAAFALRLACLMMARPARRRVIVMDEPFKSPSADRRARVRTMLENLAIDLDMQFIMVTNIEELECGSIITIEG